MCQISSKGYRLKLVAKPVPCTHGYQMTNARRFCWWKVPARRFLQTPKNVLDQLKRLPIETCWKICIKITGISEKYSQTVLVVESARHSRLTILPHQGLENTGCYTYNIQSGSPVRFNQNIEYKRFEGGEMLSLTRMDIGMSTLKTCQLGCVWQGAPLENPQKLHLIKI